LKKQNNLMTREEKLAKAIKDYPIGTKHSGISDTAKYFITETPHWSGGDICGGDIIIYSGYHKKWAEIISKPEAKTDAVEFGKIAKFIKDLTWQSSVEAKLASEEKWDELYLIFKSKVK